MVVLLVMVAFFPKKKRMGGKINQKTTVLFLNGSLLVVPYCPGGKGIRSFDAVIGERQWA
jgi:hypothetical protein